MITAMKLGDILASFDCMQHAPLQPTHHDGGILDLVISKDEQDLDEMTVDQPNIISDHSISWHLPFHHHPPIVHNREVRH